MLSMLRQKMNVRDLHSAFGLFFSLIYLYLFVTGTLSVFSREIDWLANPVARVVPIESDKLQPGQVYDAVKQSRPDWNIVRIVRSPAARYADQVYIRRNELDRLAWVDPYRGEVRGITSTHTFNSTLKELHRALSSPSKYVKFAVTAVSIPLAASVILGLMLYRRFWKGFLTKPRFHARRRAVLSDLHRLVGIWTLIFLAPLILTSFNFMLEIAGYSPPPAPVYGSVMERSDLLPSGFSGRDLDQAYQAARQTYPNLRISLIDLPSDENAALIFRGDLEAILVRPTANAVFVDPSNIHVTGSYRAEELSTHQRIFELSRTVHIGTWGGTASRIGWFLFGLALTFLTALGAMIHAEKMVMRDTRSAHPSKRGRFGFYWVGMGLGKWLWLAVFAYTLVMTLRTLI